MSLLRREDIADIISTMPPSEAAQALRSQWDVSVEAYADDRFQDYRRSYAERWEFWRNIGYWAAGVASAAVLIGFFTWLGFHIDAQGRRFGDQQTWVCSQGEAGPCALVIESYQERAEGATELDDFKSALRRVAYYRGLYRGRTGHEAPVPSDPISPAGVK